MTPQWSAALYEGDPDDEKKVGRGIEWARERGVLTDGDLVVVTGGISSEAGSTNMVRLITVSDG